MIEMKLENMAELRAAFGKDVVGKALQRAVKTAADRVASQISRDVRTRYNIKASLVKAHVSLSPIKSGGFISRLIAYTGGRISLRNFVAGKAEPMISKKTGRHLPVRVTVIKDRPRHVVRGAFLAKGWNATDDTPYLVFQRIGAERLKIRKLTGPALPTMVSNPKIIDDATDRAGTVMQAEFTRQMELLMSNTGGA
jgi:hypothetical protein